MVLEVMPVGHLRRRGWFTQSLQRVGVPLGSWLSALTGSGAQPGLRKTALKFQGFSVGYNDVGIHADNDDGVRQICDGGAKCNADDA